ncbi:cell division protein ZapE [Motiliproteus sp. SC1-56]|uniref:cell division protein ZapE n=1 Tax=Motiliproteus sp. SC1-56 TaxID=2799565 RepID=UPI001A8F61D9|nr:cell division protein ZapE [Motiliproteus sp. SC1-56]
MTPLERYHQDLTRDDFAADPAQEMAVRHLQRLYDDLLARRSRPKPRLIQRLGRRLKKQPVEPVKGLYFWGGVGRGKTYLMDTFYDSLPFTQKLRTHFHRFMQRVHRDLTELAGEKNPLDIVAGRLASEAEVICFDEFFVSDITDAMILGGLMEKLFGHGVALVATSNIIPDRLYENGLQRARFLPAIALINRYTEVVNVDGGVDYRLRTLEQAELYHHPLGDAADSSLNQSFERLAPDLNEAINGQVLEVNRRPIHSRRCCEDVVWFDFEALCEGPRSQNDYIELAKLYHAVLVSNVPVLGGERDDQARRFINLVDEFYDCGVKLILSAAAPLKDLYAGGRLEFEFERTTSRLLEMQSHEYLARAHRA